MFWLAFCVAFWLMFFYVVLVFGMIIAKEWIDNQLRRRY
jgi:hypothetical protein